MEPDDTLPPPSVEDTQPFFAVHGTPALIDLTEFLEDDDE